MVVRNIHLENAQLVKLKILSGRTGAPVAALIRKAIDAYLKPKAGK